MQTTLPSDKASVGPLASYNNRVRGDWGPASRCMQQMTKVYDMLPYYPARL